ncbi:MAG: gliding motility-associated C-terminal domain-containing protein [Saprospiraceae bacterium]|nr:gliding motility-associated C-terminal domain-containing protein [Saprospiraceae bacterium]
MKKIYLTVVCIALHAMLNNVFAQGCPGLATVTLNIVPAPVPSILGEGQFCTSSATLSVTPAFSGYTWSNGETSQEITVSTSGTYTVTVTNSNGCPGTSSAVVTFLPDLQPNISASPYTCNGQITLTADAGFNTYSWSNGSAGANTTVNSSGPYTVTVTNVDGCTGTSTFDALIPPPPAVTISGSPSVCQGESTSLSATNGFSTYAWSNGQSGASISVTNSGTYTVTVTDAFGCTATSSQVVNQIPAPIPVITGAPTACEGISITLDAGPGFNSYAWSNGTGSQTTQVSTSATYTVTVTAANGCTGTDTQNFTALPLPQPNITAAPYACDNQLVLNAGGGFSVYSWSTGTNGPSTTVTTSGNYTVTVTDASGCTGTDVFIADIPVDPVVNISGIDIFCAGGLTTFSASGGFNAYVWNTGQTGPDIDITTAGTFTVTATDAFGCTATSSLTTSLLPAPTPVISGDLSVCDGITATFDAGPGFTNYSWSVGTSTQTIDITVAGTYAVTVTAANGCTGTDSETLVLLAAPVPDILESTYLCDGELTLSAGGVFSTYNWSTGASSPAITINNSGNYQITVTGSNGCTGTDSYDVNIPGTPFVDISGDNQFCPGNTATLDATPGFVTYVWTGGQTGSTINVTQAGNYTVTVTDFFGCTATDVFGVTALTAPQPGISGPTSICAGSSATFTVNGSFSSYLWSTGQTTPSITVNAADDYTVTVTNTAGCTGTATQSLTIGNSLLTQIVVQPYLCNGQLTLDAGAGFASYLWTGGQTTQTLGITVGGNYDVTVSDVNGCSGTATINATIPPPPNVTISGDAVICQGETANLSATPGFSSYLWSNGQVGPDISVSTSNTYDVTVTDNQGCTDAAAFVVDVSAAPQPQITGQLQLCNGSSGTLSVVGSYTNYAWSTGETTPTITVNAAGAIGLTVTDANGCTGTTSQNITVGTSIQTQITALPYACNGQITLDAGAGFTTYSWTGGASTQSINATQNGTYDVTVTDAAGCTGTATAVVNIPTTATVAIVGDTELCGGETSTLTATAGFVNYLWTGGETLSFTTVSQNGTYTVTATDALGCTTTATTAVSVFAIPQVQITGPTSICNGNTGTLGVDGTYSSYAWSNGQTTPTISVNNAGTIGVTVTDANGCTGTASQNITLGTSIQTQITTLPYACDGQITLDAGAGFATYLWTGGQSTQTINATLDGAYDVTVTDAAGCTGTATADVSIPITPAVFLAGDFDLCSGESTNLTASPGFVFYQWTNGETTSFIVVNQSGTYSVTATDALGCTATASTAINVFAVPQVQITGPTSICFGSSSTFGVNGVYTSYAWSTGATTPTINVSNPGTIGVTVTDANGCTSNIFQNITQGNSIQTQITPLPYACDGQITLDAGAGFNNYLWTGGQTTQTISTTQNGTFTVTVSDGAGCSGTATINTTVPVLPVVNITGPSAFCEGETVSIAATEGFISYVWTGGETTSNVQVGQTGSYTVTVTDGLGCTTTASQNVTESPENNLQIDQLTCDPSAVGTVENTFINQFGCDSVVVLVTTLAPGLVVAAAVTTDYNGFGVACFEGSNGGVQANVSGGTAPFSFVWNQGGDTGNLSNLPAGLYTVTVTDAAGCSGTAEALLNAPVAIQIETDLDQPNCNQEGLVDITSATGGVGPYSFTVGNETQVGDGSNLVTFDGLNPGVQTIQVADNNGCIVVTEAVLQDFTPIQSTYTETYDVNAGESVQLNMPVNFVPQDIFWSPITGLSCTDCLNPSLAPANSTVINVQVEGLNGCDATGVFVINVKKGGNVYIPNVFNPSGNINNTFNAFGDDRIANIRTLQVFDRWGNKIAVINNLTPNDPTQGWDGRFRGEDMQPGVYAYWMEIEYVDGTTEVFAGDVTIVR